MLSPHPWQFYRGRLFLKINAVAKRHIFAAIAMHRSLILELEVLSSPDVKIVQNQALRLGNGSLIPSLINNVSPSAINHLQIPERRDGRKNKEHKTRRWRWLSKPNVASLLEDFLSLMEAFIYFCFSWVQLQSFLTVYKKMRQYWPPVTTMCLRTTPSLCGRTSGAKAVRELKNSMP